MNIENSRGVYVADHRGMAGSAILRRLQHFGHDRIVVATHAELNLTRQEKAEAFFQKHDIGTVYLAAAKVGGIHANNTYPAEFICTNLMMECNIIQAAQLTEVQNLLLLGQGK